MEGVRDGGKKGEVMENWYVRIPKNEELVKLVQRTLLKKGYKWHSGSTDIDWSRGYGNEIGYLEVYDSLMHGLTNHSKIKCVEYSIHDVFSGVVPDYKEPTPEKMITIDGYGEVSEATIREALKAKFS